MTDSSLPNKPSYQKGEVVHAPFAHANADGVFSKHRYAYVAEVSNGEAKLVYLSTSGRSIDQKRYAGDLNPQLDNIKKGVFWDAGTTSTVSTDFLTPSSIKLSEGSKTAIEESIVRERSDLRAAQAMVQELRAKAASAVSPGYAAEKNAIANKTAEMAQAAHHHVRITPNGDVRRLSFNREWEPVGKVLPDTMASMKKDAARYTSAPEATASTKPALGDAVAGKSPASPADGKITVLKESGTEAVLGPRAKEQLRASIHGALKEAGHAGEMPAPAEVKQIAVAAARALPGESIAVSPTGATQVLAKGTPHPAGATILDAVAVRDSAKIVEATQTRVAAAPEVDKAQVIGAVHAVLDKAASATALAVSLDKAAGLAVDKSSLLAVTASAQELLGPLMDKAGHSLAKGIDAPVLSKVVPEPLAKQPSVESVQKTTEIVAVSAEKVEPANRSNGPDVDNTLQKSGNVIPFKGPERLPDAAVQVQTNFAKGLQEAGQPVIKLTNAESTHLSKELANVKPGDHLVVEKSGDVYLSLVQPGQKQPDTPAGASVFDADALRENSGISRATGMGHAANREQASQARSEPKQAEMSRGH